jgi:hypothetical protein
MDPLNDGSSSSFYTYLGMLVFLKNCIDNMECQEDISYLLTSKDVILTKCRELFTIEKIDFLESYMDNDLMESEVSDTII